MITGNESVLKNAINLADIGIKFSAKPIIHGSLAMEYYGLRKRGSDVDFIISNEDYQVLAEKHPKSKKDMWGDLGVLVGPYELFRSVCRLDYDFFSRGAVEYEEYKVLSFDMMFFMKVMAYKHAPEVSKHTSDFDLVLEYVYDNYRNKDYVENAIKHIRQYEAAPNGTIYNDEY